MLRRGMVAWVMRDGVALQVEILKPNGSVIKVQTPTGVRWFKRADIFTEQPQATQTIVSGAI